jgi:hypothetical protein
VVYRVCLYFFFQAGRCDENGRDLLQLKMRSESRLAIRTAESEAVDCQLGQWPLAHFWHDARRN